MTKITFPADGGTICLDVVLKQDYQCIDGSSGTTVCSVYGNQYDKCPDITISSNFYPYTGFSSDLVYIDNDGCVHCDYNNDDDEETEIGEFCLETTINGKTTEECVEISVEPCGCTYGPVNIELSFPKMSANGGYSSRVCATYSYSQTNTLCSGGTETLTSGGTEEWELTYCVDGVAPDDCGEVGFITEGDSVYLVGPANEGDEERLVATVTLKVTMPDGTVGSESFDVMQDHEGECTYGTPSLSVTCDDVPTEGGCTTVKINFTQSWQCGSQSGTYNQDTTEWTYDVYFSASGSTATADGLQVCYDVENPGERRAIGYFFTSITANGVESRTDTMRIYQAEGDACEIPIIDSLSYNGLPADVGSGVSTAPTTSFYQECNGERFIWQSGDPSGGQTFEYKITPYVDGVSIDSSSGVVTMTENNPSSNNRVIGIVEETVKRYGYVSEPYIESIWQSGIDYSCEYDEPEITLEYETISSKGGEFCPTFSYSQHYKCTDGDEGYITDGATVEWSMETDHPDAVWFTGNDGCIVADSSTDTKDLCAITVKVTINGQENSKTVTVTQAGEVAGDWGWPQFSCSYANIPKDGGESDMNLTITSYKYDDAGNVVDWRTYQMEEGVVTYNDYGSDLTVLIFDFYAEVSGIEYNEQTGHLKKSSANEGGSALLLGNVLVTATAFNHMDEGLFPVYQNAETDVYVASIEESSQYSALIGTIVNRNLAEIRIYGDRYENGELVEPDVVLATIGYESNKIVSKGDVFYGHFNDGISCGEYHINKLGMRGYREQGYPQYFPNGYELRVNNNYLGNLDEPPEINIYVGDIDPITITNNGPNCELYFYHISYNQ